MVARVVTLAFEGVEAQRVDCEVQLVGGNVNFIVVGLGDKAVGESRERVRAAAGLGLALPAKRLVVNLAPADLPKEGSHYDLPIALGILAAMDIIPSGALDGWAAMGELSLDGSIVKVAGAPAPPPSPPAVWGLAYLPRDLRGGGRPPGPAAARSWPRAI